MSNDKRQYVKQETLDKAQTLYMAHAPVTTIAKDLEIPRSTLNYWIKKEWSEKRKLRGSEAFNTLAENNLSTMNQLTKDLIIIASRGASELARSNEITLADSEKAVKIMKEIQVIADKLKLDEEKEKEKQNKARNVVYIDPFQSKGE